MTSSRITPRNEERAFRLSELFFSTTDKKGVIRYGNQVFSRIAGYPLQELQGKPHNIIRHPDMPRAAFKLVWDYLKQNKVVAAYVKNLAKDGCYYWVMALVMPRGDGYLSIRLKPSSAFFPIIQGAYKELLEVEKSVATAGGTTKEAMEAATARLVELLGGLGFRSYDEFMWAALREEMTAREAGLRGGTVDPQDVTPSTAEAQGAAGAGEREQMAAVLRQCKRLDTQLGVLFSKLDSFSRFGDEIAPKTEFILRLGEEIRLLSMNAEIQSAKLGDSGATLSVVAAKLGQHSSTGAGTISRLNSRLVELAPNIAGLVFGTIVSKLTIEMTIGFLDEILVTEGPDDAHRGATDARELRDNAVLLIRSFLDKAGDILATITSLKASMGAVDREAGRMDKFVRTLAVINLAGKIETARSDTARAFNTIFEQVQAQTREAETKLSEFAQLIRDNTAQLGSIEEMDAHTYADLRAWIDHPPREAA